MSRKDTEAYVDAAASLAGFALDESSREGVIANTIVLQGMQAKFMDIPLPDDFDPAPMLRL